MLDIYNSHIPVYCTDLIHIRRAALDSQIRYILGTPSLDHSEALEELERLLTTLLPMLGQHSSPHQMAPLILLGGLSDYEHLLERWGHAELTRERHQHLG